MVNDFLLVTWIYILSRMAGENQLVSYTMETGSLGMLLFLVRNKPFFHICDIEIILLGMF